MLNGKVSNFPIGGDQTVTIACKLNTAGEKPCLDIYLNGEYAGALNCDLFAGNNTNIDFANANITRMNFNGMSNTVDPFIIDNVCFK